ncbi:unnamed protein product [Brassica rapa subsp. narinosa]
METRVVKEGDVEKHIGGCMAGFFNIFDRPHLLSPKRFSLPKRLSSSSYSLKTEPSLDSGSHSVYSTPQLRSPAPPEFKQQVVSPRRFSKEAPRLSLDSRAVVDAKGSLKPRQIHADVGSGSPSVIARLMGLEALPDSQQQQPLQRSASESRVISRFVDRLNFQNQQSSSTQGVEEDHHSRKEPSKASSTPVPLRRKSFFDTADFFPEPRQVMSRGSESDLETLKQLLEALRLKGLLHSCSTNRNVIVPQSPIRSVPSKRDLNKGKTLRRSENSVKTPNRRPTPKDSWRAEHVHTRNLSRRRPIEDDHEEFNRHGKTLLERCDKLLNSIAEMAASEVAAAGDSQPSPVSVLDASLYQEDSSPSPVMKRTLHFTELLLEDESFTSSSSDSEYDYISDILRASSCLPQESDIFSLLEEKQQYLKGAHERRLTFDAVQEIVGRIRRRGRMVGDADEMLQLTWSEFQKLRKKSSSPAEEEAADLVGYVCRVLGRDLTEDPWRDFQVETSEAVLVIERLVFKDLVGETIRHMAALNRSVSLRRRRRLLF